MAEGIEIVASLAVSASAAAINKQLDELANKINPVKIQCEIDTKGIQNKLNNLTKGIKLDVPAAAAQKVNVADSMSVAKMASALRKEFNLQFIDSQSQTKELKELLTVYKQLYDTGDFKGAQSAWDALSTFISRYQQEVTEADRQTKELRDTIKSITQGGKLPVLIDEVFRQKTKSKRSMGGTRDSYRAVGDLGENSKQVLDTIFGVGHWAYGNKKSGVSFESVLSEVAKEIGRDDIDGTAEGILKVYDLLVNKASNVADWADTLSEKEQELKAEYDITSGFKRATGMIAPYDSSDDGFVDILGDDIDFEQATQSVSNYEQKLEELIATENLLDDASEASEAKLAKFAMAQDLLAKDFDILSEKVRKAGVDLEAIGGDYYTDFNDIMDEGIADNKQLSEARYNLSAMRKEWQLLNASMKSDLPQNAIENLNTNAEKLDNKIKNVVVDYGKIAKPSAELTDLVARLQDFDTANVKPTDIDDNEILKQKIALYNDIKANIDEANREIKLQAKLEEEAAKALKAKADKEEVYNNNVRKTAVDMQAYAAVNKNSVTSSELMSDGRSFAQAWQEIEVGLKNAAANGTGLAQVNEQLKIFKAEVRAAGKESKALSDDITLENKIRKLSADLDVFAKNNQKAINSTKFMSDGRTFAQAWQEISNGIKKAGKSGDDIKHLNEQLAIFKAEAKSAGLVSNSLFAGMGEQITQLAKNYLSFYTIFNKVVSTISELKEVNNILTEISKTSDRTVDSLERLGNASFSTASDYGRKATDYLYGVQEMSRAGFGEYQSEALAELSLQTQAAGDLTADMANKYLIATNAAFSYNGSVERLTKTLDGQNYVTNRNALNMEDLTNATRLAASQADAAGVTAGELTAAVGTMIATTQQGGEIAGRAFRGILMNIQQIKASADDIGDGGLDITSSSLSKYEKASEALGVSLKEVKNGVWALRDPMQVLRDLSIAVSKESENSIKVANLISAVGGKYRGNQLIALLKNWDSYEKMLTEFNSSEAVGSAMQEAEKSANNWEGSLNKLSNTWTELVNKIINSNDMIAIIQNLNNILQNVSNESIVGSLRDVVVIINTVTKAVAALSEHVGLIPILLTAIARAKHISIFDTLTKTVTQSARAFAGLKGALQSTTVAAEEAEAASAMLTGGLKLLADLLIVVGISKLVEGMRSISEQSEKAAESVKEFKERTESIVASTEQEQKNLKDIIQSYTDVYTSTSDINNVKTELLDIQSSLIDKYGTEAEGIDLVNSKYSESIDKLKQLSAAKKQQWLDENAPDIRTAERVMQGYFGGLETEYYFKGLKDVVDTLDNVEINENIFEALSPKGDKLLITGSITQQIEALKALRDVYGEVQGYNEEAYNYLTKEIQLREEIYQNAKEVLSLSQQYGSGLADNTAFDFASLQKPLNEIGDTFERLSGDFDELFDKSFDKTSKNISKVQDAIQTIANGDVVDWDKANELLFTIDTDHYLNNLEMVDGGYVTINKDLTSLIDLKDSIVRKQIEEIKLEKERINLSLQTLKNENLAYGQRLLASSNSKSDAEYAKKYLDDVTNEISEITDLSAHYDELIKYLNSKLGNTVDLTEAIAKNQKKADEYAKSMTKYIDTIIDGVEAEKDALSAEKDAIQTQVDALNEKKDLLQEIVDDYDKINDAVQKELDAIKETLEKQQKLEEDVLQKQIDALKEKKEQQDEETSLAEKELAVQQKLADLEKARNKRVRTYSAETGWTWGGDKEAVANAEKDYNDAKKNYDDAIADKSFNDQIKTLEKQKDAITESYEAQIKAYEEYGKEWGDISKIVEDENAARLAEEQYGSDWREKIKNKDVKLLDTYRSAYKTYNSQIDTLTNKEIKTLEKSIKAKDKEIKAKEAQIDEWKKYKSAVEKAVSDINNANDNYLDKLGNIKLTEQSSLEERTAAFENFKNHYQEIMDMINELGNQDTSINLWMNLDDVRNNLADFMDEYRDAVEAMRDALEASTTGFGTVNSAWDAKLAAAANELRYGRYSYATGGVVDYTGAATVHGKKNASEVVFNSAQAKSLYDMVRDGNFANNVATGIFDGLSKRFAGSTNNSSVNTININGMTIKTDNPQQFHDQFMTEIGKYWNVKLTESRVR